MTDNIDGIIAGGILDLDLAMEYREKFGDTYSTVLVDHLSPERLIWLGKQMRRALDGKRAPVTDQDIWGDDVYDNDI